MKPSRTVILLGAVALVPFTGVGPSAGQAQEMPCTQEIQALCSDVQLGGGRILQCLKNNESKLSPACVKRVHDFEAALSGPLGVCRDDWVAYCYHPRGSGDEGMLQCLQMNEASVSKGCQKALEGMGGKRGKPRGALP